MRFTSTCPRRTDSDNILLFKIAQALCGGVAGGGGDGSGESGGISASIVSETGAANIAASQAVTGVAPALVLNPRLTRKSVAVKNIDAAITIYLGHNATVSSLNGMELKGGESIAIDSTAGIYAVAASGTPRLAFLEEYN